MTERFAIYFVPHTESLLWQLGCLWLGRNALGGSAPQHALPAWLATERYLEIVDAPRRYGFHATLKAPFSLAPEMSLESLVSELVAFTASLTAFVAPALTVSRTRGFLALTLCGPSLEMRALCDACVTSFDRYRKPEAPDEVQRRRIGIAARQRDLLDRWGYPFVLDEFHFHMTLTKRLDEPELSAVERHLQSHFAAVLAAPLFVDRIALFHQPARNEPFSVLACIPFGSTPLTGD